MKQEGDPFTQPEELSAPPIVTAGFESEWTECLGWINEGDEIQADGHGGWKHAECLPLLLVNTGNSCPSCFTKLAANGACNCD